jgi:RNA polymerase sigma-B factor
VTSGQGNPGPEPDGPPDAGGLPKAHAGAGSGYEHLLPVFAAMARLTKDNPERDRLRDRLVAEHLPVAHNIARRFRGRGESQDDLKQVAVVGLINAVDRFEPDRGSDFLAFAVPTIMGEVRRYFRDASWSVRVPRRLKELHISLSSASAKLSQELGHAPTARQLAEHLGLSIDLVYEGLEAGNAYHAVPLEPAANEPEAAGLGNTLGEYDQALEQVEYRESLQPLLEELPERERTILVLRFFGNMTQTQIAEQVGISQMHVSRVLRQTLTFLRQRMSNSE